MTFDTAFEWSHPPNTTTKEKDANIIHNLFAQFHYADDLGVIKSKLTEYVTTVRKEARAAAHVEMLNAVTQVKLACGATGSADFQEGIRNGVILGANQIRDVLRATIEAAANTSEGGGDG